MRVQVVMPQLGESIVEGTIVEWHKKIGDYVKQNEELFTLTTDKVDTGVPAPQAGVLVEILANVDQTISVGEGVAVIDTAAQAGATAAAPAAPAPAAALAATPAAPQAPAPAAPAAVDDEGDTDGEPTARLSPVAKNLLDEAGITDFSTIEGTGVGGRILKQDAQNFIDARATAPADTAAPQAVSAPRTPQLASPVPPSATSTPTSAGVTQIAAPPIMTRSGSTPMPASAPAAAIKAAAAPPAAKIVEQRPPRPQFSLPMIANAHSNDTLHAPAVVVVGPDDRVEPMSRSRIAVSANLTHARRTAAHCATVWEADMTGVVDARNRLHADYAKLNVNLTYTPFFLAAIASALGRFPVLNSATDGENIIFRSHITLGIASAWKDGLIVPTIKNANSLSLLGITRATNDIQRRTEEGDLRPSDLETATFTITNTGVLGAKYGVPTLFPPQVGILSLGTIEKRVVVGKDDSLRVRSMVSFCLSFDHRVVDFNDADGFMKHIVEYLETTEW